MSKAKRRILIVDDELHVLNDHVHQLVTGGFEVAGVRTTDEAIREILQKDVRQYDLVAMDMMIPPPEAKPSDIEVWDGLRSGGHLLLMLRKLTEDLPVLLLSNLDEEEVQLEAWDRFMEHRTRSGRAGAAPPVHSTGELRGVLERDFRTWFRSKRRTPPWHFPKILSDILAAAQR